MTNSQVESFRTHSNYIRAFATLIGTDNKQSAHKIERSGCLTKSGKTSTDYQQVLSSLKNAWGTELLINMGKHFVNESELVKLSNNWSTVQAYYVLYHSTQAVAVAKGYSRPLNHPRTQSMFYNLWANRNLCLEPWTLAYGCNGARNIPSHVKVDDNIHNWSLCSPSSAWSLVCKALKTTREDNLDKSFKNAREKKRSEKRKLLKQQQAKRLELGRKPKTIRSVSLPQLTLEEKRSLDQKEPPTTIIDYLYRLRIKTNYVDSGMFTDGPENDPVSFQVRDDLNTIAGGVLLLAELTVSNIVSHNVFFGWINDWVRTNVPNDPVSAIRNRLPIHQQI